MIKLPVYKKFYISDSYSESLKEILEQEMNISQPVVVNLKKLNEEDQFKALGMINSHFEYNNLSPLFPYPVYVVCDIEQNGLEFKLFKSEEELPKFFKKITAKTTIKENQIAEKNSLFQKSIRNSDLKNHLATIRNYAKKHSQIYDLENEYFFYLDLLNSMERGK